MTSWTLFSVFLITFFQHGWSRPFDQRFSFPDFDAPDQSNICPVQPVPVSIPSLVSQPLIETALNQLEGLLSGSITNSTASGVYGIVTYQNQTIWSWGFGTVNKSEQIVPNADSVFRFGSVTKVFTTVILYQLFQQGIVKSLDDQISDYVNFSMISPFPMKRGITWRQVASQMSGLPREAPCGICNVTTEEILERLTSQYLIMPPWTRPSYSNLGFSLIGRILSELPQVNMLYEDYVTQNILQPLGMTSTGFNFTEEIIERMPVGYNTDGSVVELVNLDWSAPAGQMYSTANDMAKFAQFFSGVLSSQSVLDPSIIKEMLSPLFVQSDGQTIFATPFEAFYSNNYVARRKGGNLPGWSTGFSVIPELQLGLNLFWNGGVDEFGMMNAANDILVPAFVSTLENFQPGPTQPPKPANYYGYFSVMPGIGAEIMEYQGQLLAKFLIPSVFGVYLQYVDATHLQVFLPPGLPGETCNFYDLTALVDQYLVFELNSNGVAESFTIPGWIPGATFTKTTDL
eukprot:TRINITY_DN676_c0_g1_i5.p1 TRINITY_DN676_c0_g1~~TRINITY_DN676_c0_g1_i5.p1  ORF type:complete len:515 (+),score=84.78 TRINITY_DN676_c0_g1_i5:227-1771(+)